MSATLTVLDPGLCTLVVDHGRPRCRSLGVPVGGAADRFALAIGNALVGNDPETAALEVCLVGPKLMAEAPLACVLFGAPFAMRTDNRPLTAGTTFTLQAGERLLIGGCSQGARAYLCVRGGIDAPLIMGSRSSLAALKASDSLRCKSGSISARFIDIVSDNGPLRVLAGGQSDWFPPDALSQGEYEVTTASNRMGVRLRGEPLPISGREIVSEPVCPGTVQVTRDGQCIILGVDGQTIGGYPKIAHVISADLDRLGQLRPGQRVRFECVAQAQAEELLRLRDKILREWLTRLRTMGTGD